MNETIKKMIERRSVREFRTDTVPKDVLERIVNAGIFAPNGRGKQSPIVIVVTDKATRDRMSKVNAEIMGTTKDPFYGAPVIITVLAPRDVPTHVYDGSLVMGNLMLAAHSEGVSSCWIHRAKETFERDEWKKWLLELGIEGDYVGIGNCALGYAKSAYPDIIPRKEGRVFWVE